MESRPTAHRTAPDRRQIVVGGLAIGGFALFGGATAASCAPASAREEDADGNILVVLQLSGGNDGLCTIVPHADDRYHAARTTTRVPAESVLKIDDYRGFHPLLAGMRKVYDRGQLAIVEGVGYAKPNRSHFASFDIWHAASERGREAGDGWLARLAGSLPGASASGGDVAVHVGERLPYSLFSPSAPCACFRDPGIYRWNQNEGPICETAEGSASADGGMGERTATERAGQTFLRARDSSARIREAAASYEPRAAYPNTELGSSMQAVAALLQGGVGARILSVELIGFDTHATQKPRHERLLRYLDGALSAFLDDIQGTPRGDRTVVMVFSEFGRRVAENASTGTDHGTAGPMFLAGTRVKGGLYGKHPSLEDLDEGDLKFNTDFRSVYASVIQGWCKLDPASVLGQSYPTLPLFA